MFDDSRAVAGEAKSEDREVAVRQALLGAIRDRPDSTEAVTSGIPLLVVAGEQDPLIPVAVAEALASQSPAGRAEGLDCGHLPNWEWPDEFNLMLSAVVASL